MKRPPPGTMALLYSQLALHRGGVASDRRIVEALAADEDRRAGAALRELAALLGMLPSLADAMERLPAVFAPETVALLRQASEQGRSAGALELLARDSLWLDQRTRENWGGMSYPVLLMVGVAALLGLMSIVVVPPFQDVLQSMGSELPALTRFVLALAPSLTIVALVLAALWLLPGVSRIPGLHALGARLAQLLGRLVPWRQYRQLGIEPRVVGAAALALRHGLPLTGVAAHLRANARGHEARVLGALEARLAGGMALGAACLAVPELPRRVGLLATEAEARGQDAEALEQFAALAVDHSLELRERLRRRATGVAYALAALTVALCILALYLPIFKLGGVT